MKTFFYFLFSVLTPVMMGLWSCERKPLPSLPAPPSAPTLTSTVSGTATSTLTPTVTPTPTSTGTATLSPTKTSTSVPSPTPTPTLTGTVTGTLTFSPTVTSTGTPTPTGTPLDACLSSAPVSISGTASALTGALYVSNITAVSVQVINSGSVVLTIPIQATSIGNMAFTPDGKELYVAANNIFGGSLSGFAVINTDPSSSNENQVTYLRLDSTGVGLVTIDHAGAYAYFSDGCGVEVLNIQPSSSAYEQVVADITGFTTGLIGEAAFTPNGNQLWWPESGSYGVPSLVAVINSNPASAGFATKQEITLTSGGNPQGISVSADGTRAFLSMWSSGGVQVINTSTFGTVTTFTGGSGFGFRGNTLSFDGSTLWVASDGGTYLEEFSVNSATDTYSYVNQLQFDSTTSNIHYDWLSKDGSTAYIPGYSAQVLYQANITTNPPTAISPISLGGTACYMAVHP